MDPMHDDEDVTLNAKAIGLAIGGAALAGLLNVMARRESTPTPVEQAEAVLDEVKDNVEDDVKKAAKAAKKKRKALKKSLGKRGAELSEHAQRASAEHAQDLKAAERDLKAAAWDAQQEAREAESRLRAARSRVVGDATHLASRVGHEARNLAGEGRERISHLRHRDDLAESSDDELQRLRDELERLRREISGSGQRGDRDFSGIVSKLAGKSGPMPASVASEAMNAALVQLEKSLKAKAPALLAAKDRKQLLEILQAEVGPTLRDSVLQGAAAALGKWDSTKERAEDAGHKVGAKTKAKAEDVVSGEQELRQQVRADVTEAIESVDNALSAAKSNGKHRFWQSRHDESADVVEPAQVPEVGPIDEAASSEHKSRAGLLWTGAGVGLALYALLDAERREQFLRMANEASVQVQELVRDLQGYDDEFS